MTKQELQDLIEELKDDLDVKDDEIKDLKEEIKDLKSEHKEEIEALEDQINNPFDSVVENMKYEFFMDNFHLFTQDQLEQLIK